MNEIDEAVRKRRRAVWVAMGLLVAALLGVANLRRFRDVEQVRQQEAEAEERIDAAAGRIETLETRRQHLLENSAAIERLARENLVMARPEEVVLLIPPEPETITSPNADGDPVP